MKIVFILTEYDRYLASSKIMAAAYLDPNLNHTPNSSTKTHLGTGVERSPGAMERVLKVFHYFDSNSEPTTWACIIRHGDATDVRVSAASLGHRQWVQAGVGGASEEK